MRFYFSLISPRRNATAAPWPQMAAGKKSRQNSHSIKVQMPEASSAVSVPQPDRKAGLSNNAIETTKESCC
jgi:hypothetical protein